MTADLHDLVAGTTVLARDFTPHARAYDNTQLSATNPNWDTGSPIVRVDFVAPTTGRVLVSISAGTRDSAGAARVFASFDIRELGTNVVMLSPDVSTHGISNSEASVRYEFHSRDVVVEGLLPGAQYYARVMHKNAGVASSQNIRGRLLCVSNAC